MNSFELTTLMTAFSIGLLSDVCYPIVFVYFLYDLISVLSFWNRVRVYTVIRTWSDFPSVLPIAESSNWMFLLGGVKPL